jgi:hypothetical protein
MQCQVGSSADLKKLVKPVADKGLGVRGTPFLIATYQNFPHLHIYQVRQVSTDLNARTNG